MYRKMKTWMELNRLTLNINKTQCIRVGSRQQLAKVSCGLIYLDGSDIQLSTRVTFFDVIIDSELKFDVQIRRLSSRCFYYIRHLRTVRRVMTVETTKHWIMYLI